tara:strand:- start:474 stop:764 length:291 start_codon:yes stop_codon:yes gene_type:complete
MHENKGSEEPNLSSLLKKLSAVDLVLLEGFKKEKHKKLEVYRGSNRKPLLQPEDPNICGIASDIQLDNPAVPVFDLRDIESIASFIMQSSGLLETL